MSTSPPRNHSSSRSQRRAKTCAFHACRYNGFVPTSESGCATKALSVYCNGTSTCDLALDALCHSARPDANGHHHPDTSCLQCVGQHIGDPRLASCADAAVARFCTLGRNASLVTQTQAECQACADKLKHKEMTCHILHNPVRGREREAFNSQIRASSPHSCPRFAYAGHAASHLQLRRLQSRCGGRLLFHCRFWARAGNT